MPLAVWFWIGMFLWLVLGAVVSFRPWPNGSPAVWAFGNSLLLFLLLALLGWKVFGSAVR